MSAETTMEITCPKCGTVWREDIENLERVDQELIRAVKPIKRVEKYRVLCPTDHTRWVITVMVEEEGDG